MVCFLSDAVLTMADQNLVFVLGDFLPTYYEAGISIYSIATNPKSKKMGDVVCAYSKALINAWECSFGTEHVLSRSNVVKKLEKLVDHYYTNVYNIVHRHTKKHMTDVPTKVTSIRCLNKEWRSKTIVYGNNNQPGILIDSLLDIGRNTDKLTNAELWFYEDQKNLYRIHRLSEEIDVEWVEEQIRLREQQEADVERLQQQAEAERMIEQCDETVEETCDDLNASRTRSGKCRIPTEDQGTQTDDVPIQLKVRNNRNCTDKIKSTCVQLSVNCGISAKMSTVAAQTFFKGMLDHDVYLTKEEAVAKDPTLASYREVEEGNEQQVQNKRQKLMGTVEKKKTPTTKGDYIPYRNVLPSPKTINDYKQLLAVQEEADAANCLYNMPSGVTCTLHYDTTSRCKIDGEWPAIIFSFSNGHRYSLRPLFFAFEDRAQIVRLLAETYKRLAICVTSKSVDTPVAAKDLWEKTSVIMTDSVEKNLKIEDGIAASLGSTYKPLHTLCKAHTVEALDRSNLAVLAKMEHKIKFRQALESINPGVKSF